MKDKVGHEIQVGDAVAYATRRFSSCYLKVGKVLEVEEDGIKVRGLNKTWDGKVEVQRAAWLHAAERVMVVEPGDLKVHLDAICDELLHVVLDNNLVVGVFRKRKDAEECVHGRIDEASFTKRDPDTWHSIGRDLSIVSRGVK